jgi:hypothetical protein
MQATSLNAMRSATGAFDLRKEAALSGLDSCPAFGMADRYSQRLFVARYGDRPCHRPAGRAAGLHLEPAFMTSLSRPMSTMYASAPATVSSCILRSQTSAAAGSRHCGSGSVAVRPSRATPRPACSSCVETHASRSACTTPTIPHHRTHVDGSIPYSASRKQWLFRLLQSDSHEQLLSADLGE